MQTQGFPLQENSPTGMQIMPSSKGVCYQYTSVGRKYSFLEYRARRDRSRKASCDPLPAIFSHLRFSYVAKYLMVTIFLFVTIRDFAAQDRHVFCSEVFNGYNISYCDHWRLRCTGQTWFLAGDGPLQSKYMQ